MGRSAVVGPAAGGCVVIPLHQRRDATTTLREEGICKMPYPFRVISAMGHAQAAPNQIRTEAGASALTPLPGLATTGLFLVSNEGKAPSGGTGIAWSTPQSNRSAREITDKTTQLELAIDGTGAGAPVFLSVTEHVVCALTDHRYSSPAND